MSITEFSLSLGLYDVEYTCIEEYGELLLDLSLHITPVEYWQRINRGTTYDLARLKSLHSQRTNPKELFMLFLMYSSGQRDSAGVVSAKDIFYLYSMTEGPHPSGICSCEFRSLLGSRLHSRCLIC